MIEENKWNHWKLLLKYVSFFFSVNIFSSFYFFLCYFFPLISFSARFTLSHWQNMHTCTKDWMNNKTTFTANKYFGIQITMLGLFANLYCPIVVSNHCWLVHFRRTLQLHHLSSAEHSWEPRRKPTHRQCHSTRKRLSLKAQLDSCSNKISAKLNKSFP